MDNFNLKKYLAESKLFEERKDIGTPEELKSFLYSRQSDIVGWVKEAIENHGEENISWEEDIKQWIADDAGEITPAKFQLTYNDTTYDGYDEYMFESVYEEFVQSTYNKFFGKTAEYDENQLELAEGKLLEGIWNIGNPDDIRDFIKKVNTLQKDYWEVVGSDTVMNGLDSAMDEAKILLDVKMGNVQPEEFDLKVNENLVKENDKNDYANSEEDYTDKMVIEKIKDIIRYHELDPSDVLEEIGQEFGVAFEFGRG
mgnify:CR=1 FL=1